jgi:hypothetical protein
MLFAGIWIFGLLGRIVFSLGMPSYGKKTIGTVILGFMGILATLVISLGLSNFN